MAERNGQQRITLLLGDCVERMAKMEDNSIGAIVCDPPYLINFMGKKWDKPDEAETQTKNSSFMQLWHENWLRGAFRVLKPGGVIKAMSGTRTSTCTSVNPRRQFMVGPPAHNHRPAR